MRLIVVLTILAALCANCIAEEILLNPGEKYTIPYSSDKDVEWNEEVTKTIVFISCMTLGVLTVSERRSYYGACAGLLLIGVGLNVRFG